MDFGFSSGTISCAGRVGEEVCTVTGTTTGDAGGSTISGAAVSCAVGAAACGGGPVTGHRRVLPRGSR